MKIKDGKEDIIMNQKMSIKKKLKKLPKLKHQVLKQFAVNITYNYLLKAPNSQEAIKMSMDRLLGRKFTGVYFDGMVTNVELTDKEVPNFDHIKVNKAMPDDERSIGYGLRDNRDRKDTKEQDYIHFDSADQI